MLSIYNARYFDKVALSIPGYREITNRLIQLIEKKSRNTILDLGAGTSRVAVKLADSVYKVIAVDKSEEMLDKLDEKIRRKHIDNIEIIKKDITGWEFLWPNTEPILTECMFTSIICSFVLLHLNDKRKAIVLERLRGSLKSDGRIFIADIKPEKAWQVRKGVNKIYWRLITERERKYLILFTIKYFLSCLFCEHLLSENKWREVLKETGYSNIMSEDFNNFMLLYAKN